MDKLRARRLLVAGGAILGSTAMLLAGCDSGNATKPTPGISQTAEKPGTSATPSQTPEHWAPEKGDYLSADQIAELDGDYDKLIEAYTIHGDDFNSFEEFVHLQNYVEVSYLRSGTSAAEIEKFKGAPTQLEDYASDTYAAPFAGASSYRGAIDPILDNHHKVVATNYILTRYTGTGVGYVFNQDVVNIKSTKGKITDKTFTVTYDVQQSDNFEDTNLTQISNVKERGMKSELEITVVAHRMADGSIKTETHWGDAQ